MFKGSGKKKPAVASRFVSWFGMADGTSSRSNEQLGVCLVFTELNAAPVAIASVIVVGIAAAHCVEELWYVIVGVPPFHSHFLMFVVQWVTKV